MLYIESVPRDELQYYGGSVELADYCPYNQEFEWRERRESTDAADILHTQTNATNLGEWT